MMFRIALAFLNSKLIDMDTKRGFNRLFNKPIKIATVCQGMYINKGVHLFAFYFGISQEKNCMCESCVCLIKTVLFYMHMLPMKGSSKKCFMTCKGTIQSEISSTRYCSHCSGRRDCIITDFIDFKKPLQLKEHPNFCFQSTLSSLG